VEKESRRATRLSARLQRKGAARFEGLKNFPGLNLRGPITRAPPATRDIAPESTRVIAGTFRSADGSRNYKLLVPSRCQEKPLPLVAMLHGCTQSPDDFAAGTRMAYLAEERNCFVVYPDQPRGANQAKCWNWFRGATSSGMTASLR
jgi:poly(3-hydroxybutyrate) depolymerase